MLPQADAHTGVVEKAVGVFFCHAPSLAFQHLFSKLRHNWLCHWRGTTYLCVFICGNRPCWSRAVSLHKVLKKFGVPSVALKHTHKHQAHPPQVKTSFHHSLKQFWFHLYQRKHHERFYAQSGIHSAVHVVTHLLFFWRGGGDQKSADFGAIFPHALV